MADYPAQAAPLARALVLGEEDLEPEEGEAFRRSGLAHLLAVSGTHLVLVVAGAVRVLGALLLEIRPLAARVRAGALAAAAGVPLAFLYADFAGGSGSARRAAVMLAALLLAQALGRRGDATRALGLSLLLLGAWEPLAAFDLSLLLSASATAGFCGWAPAGRGAARAAPRAADRGGERDAGGAGGLRAAAVVGGPGATAGRARGQPAGGARGRGGGAACLHRACAAPGAAARGAALVGGGALLVVRAIAQAAALAPGLPTPPLSEAQGALLLAGVACGGALAPTGERGAAARGLAARGRRGGDPGRRAAGPAAGDGAQTWGRGTAC